MSWDPQRPPERPDPRTEPAGAPMAGGGVFRCYRHPDEETRIRCSRCGRPICTSCMIPAPVGHQCPECVGQARREFRMGARRRARTVMGLSATNLLLLAIAGVFAVEVIVSHGRALSFTNGLPNQTAFDMGALYPPAVAGLHSAGFSHPQYWRLFTAMFLHANILHIGFNAWALWIFGNFVETTFGRTRMVLIYLVTGLFASATSYTFGPVFEVGVGASGAIVGLLGAFMAYNFRRRHSPVAQGYLRWALMLIVLNAIFGATFAGVDNWAHGGGLVSGFAAGLIADGIGPREMQPAIRVVGFVAILAIGAAMVVLRTHSLLSG